MSLEPKILISYSEYERLQLLAAKYAQLKEQQHLQTSPEKRTILHPSGSQSGAKPDSQIGGGCLRPTGSRALGDSDTETSQPEGLKNYCESQIGGGFSVESFIDKVANVVTKHLVQFHQPNPNWKYYDRAEPLQVSDPLTTLNKQSEQFGVPIKENDLSDKFDEIAVLKRIPLKHRKQAKVLLDIFNARSDVITFDLNGTVYLSGESLPQSNITDFLLQLFKVRSSPAKLKRLSNQGFNDFVAQLQAMGLSHLFPYDPTKMLGKEVSNKTKPKVSVRPEPSANVNTDEWWLLV